MKSKEYQKKQQQQNGGYHEDMPENVNLSNAYCASTVAECKPFWISKGKTKFCNRAHAKREEFMLEVVGIEFETVRDVDSVNEACSLLDRMIRRIGDALASKGWAVVGFDIEGNPQDVCTMQFAVRVGVGNQQQLFKYFLPCDRTIRSEAVVNKLREFFKLNAKFAVHGTAEGKCLERFGIYTRLSNLEEMYQELPGMRVETASLSLLHYIFFGKFMLKDEKLQRFDWKTSRDQALRRRATQYAMYDAIATLRLFEVMSAYIARLEDARRRAREAEKGQ
jgi:hypothetical protein